jgi:hypothetical protein
LTVAVSGATACSRATGRANNTEVVLEIFNAQPVVMSVSYTTGNSASVTRLGSIDAKDTKRWAVSGSQGMIHLVAIDSASVRTVRKDVSLGGTAVARWEIR